jgi:hypothetical protein
MKANIARHGWNTISVMKSLPAGEQTHANQNLSKHKYKYNTKLGNEFSLDEQEIMRNGKRGEKGKQIGKTQTHHLPSIRQAEVYIINIIT